MGIENNFAEFKFIKHASRIIVGVSGGADSVVLAHLLKKHGFDIAIAHCHFNLRGKDADADQQFTKELASKMQVPFYTIKFETQTYADTRKISIQMAARNLRYFWFEKLCTEHGFDQIAVGTHLTDNIETFLFNATKGTGLSGLRGIKPVNGKIIRPLLHNTKDEIYEYAKAEDLTWREDESNKSIRYHRNKIRHQVLPVLKDINPNLEATFERNFKRLGRVDAFLQNEISEIWDGWVKPEKKGWRLSKSDISNHPFADVVLSYKLPQFGFNDSNVHDLLKALKGQPGSMISSKDYHIYIDRKEIFIQQQRFFSLPNQYQITEFMGEISNPIKLRFTDLHAQKIQFATGNNTAYFDFDKLKFPLTLRKWKNGDTLKPFGMKGVKKVSDLLINHKIPLHEKENVWVLESDGKICWVVGIRSSEEFKVADKTKRVYLVEVD